VLDSAELDEFARDGYVFIDRVVLDQGQLLEARGLIDSLFEARQGFSSRLATTIGEDEKVLEVMYPMNLEPQLRKLNVVQHCRSIACELLGSRQTWCHFDHVIYKQPGGGPVAWHQDLAASRTGWFQRAAHFWIPLHDLAPESGCMMFVPGSHRGDLYEHVHHPGAGGVQIKMTDKSREATIATEEKSGGFDYVTKVLPLGGFSVHTPRTLHASAPNQGDELRKAWILQFGTGPASAARELGRRTLAISARRKAH